jgi:hypothetical protein
MIAQGTQLQTITQKDFTDLVARTFVSPAVKPTPVARQLFMVDPVGEGNGVERLYQEYDSETFAKTKTEGAAVAKARAGHGYDKRARLKRFGIEIDITEEERKYNKYPEVIRKLTSLAEFGTQRQELDLTHRFTFAGATTYVNRDGDTIDISTGNSLSLVNASQTLAFSSVTYSNNVSGNPVFSSTSLEAAQTLAATQIFSAFGEKRVMNFNTIVTADYPTVINEVRRQLQSTAQVSATNAGVVNVFLAQYKHLILPYLATTASGAYDSAKKNYWFLVAAGQWQGMLAEWEPERLVTPSPGNNLVDGHSDVWTYGVRIGYDIACVTGKGVIGSLNAS